MVQGALSVWFSRGGVECVYLCQWRAVTACDGVCMRASQDHGHGLEAGLRNRVLVARSKAVKEPHETNTRASQACRVLW